MLSDFGSKNSNDAANRYCHAICKNQYFVKIFVQIIKYHN